MFSCLTLLPSSTLGKRLRAVEQLVITPMQCIFRGVFQNNPKDFGYSILNLDTVFGRFLCFWKYKSSMHNYSKRCTSPASPSYWICGPTCTMSHCLLLFTNHSGDFLYARSLAKHVMYPFSRPSCLGLLGLWKSLWLLWWDRKNIAIIWEMGSEVRCQLYRMHGNSYPVAPGGCFKPGCWG